MSPKEDTQKNEHAAALARLGAAKGGRARAQSLTSAERQAIARGAAAARWADKGRVPLPRATHDGTLKLGDLELPCAVLDSGTRVLSERALAGVLGASRGGNAYGDRRARDGGAVLPIYLGADRLRPFISSDLLAALNPPVEYIPKHGGRSALGVKADAVPLICEVWLKAREQGSLTIRQRLVAHKAEIIMRGLAHIGIIALVDEATGFQDDRARDALARILERFIAKELRPWVSMFPPEFYKQMFRLRGWEYSEKTTARPKLVGKLTDNIVYKRLAPGVRDELRRLTPRNASGRLKNKLFQWLSENEGVQRLHKLLLSETTLMEISEDWEQFIGFLDRVHPEYGKNMVLPNMPVAKRVKKAPETEAQDS
jgi:hypothetical protein